MYILAVPPSSPEITDAYADVNGTAILLARANHEITLECIVRDGYPPGTVSWYKGSVGSTALTSQQTTTEANGLLTVSSTYTMTPTDADDRTIYVCQSQYDIAPIEESSQLIELHIVGMFRLQRSR